MGNFKIGEKVVAKDLSNSCGIPYGITKGEIYEIDGFINCNCGELVLLKGVDSGSRKYCNCGKLHPTNTFYAWRFRKLDYAHTEKICAEIIESLKIKEVQLN